MERSTLTPTFSKPVELPANGILTPEDSIPEVVLYPQFDMEDRRREAYVAFMRGDNVTKISVDCEVDERTIRKWAAKGKWIERISEERAIERYEDEKALDAFRRSKRLKELQEQFDAGTRMQDLLMELVRAAEAEEIKVTPDGIKKLAEAMKVIHDSKARIIGLNEGGATVDQQSKAASEGTGKQPMIAIVLGQTGKPLGRVIDIRSEG